MWAFGLVLYEILTGVRPWSRYRGAYAPGGAAAATAAAAGDGGGSAYVTDANRHVESIRIMDALMRGVNHW